jgi:hypothetical protein
MGEAYGSAVNRVMISQVVLESSRLNTRGG